MQEEYSQQKFARALGVSYVTYNQKENGKKPISIDQFVKILEILKIPDNEINIFLLMTFIKKNKKMECEGVFMIYGEDNFAIKLSISNLPELDLFLKKYYKNQTELSKTELKVLEKVGRQKCYGKQAAEFLGVSPSTFWSWTKRYDIEFLMIDGLANATQEIL